MIPDLSLVSVELKRRSPPSPPAGKGLPYERFAPIYDMLLGDRFFRQLRRNFELLIHRYGIRFNSVADVACGTGTFVRYLCQIGTPLVFGVDRSPDMLRLAMAKNPRRRAKFLRQEFANLQLPVQVDLITSNFDSLNYLLKPADLLRAFQRFHANLKPGGFTIFDAITDWAHWQEFGPRIEDVRLPEGRFTRLTRLDPSTNLQRAIVTIEHKGRKYREIHTQRGYSPAVIMRLIRRSGLSPLQCYDFHTLQPATSITRRVMYLARRG